MKRWSRRSSVSRSSFDSNNLPILFAARMRRFIQQGLLILAVTLLMAACAAPQKTMQTADQAVGQWMGRLSLQIQSEPAQSFSASFELRGQASAGELVLISPLGNTLGILRWSPSEALLDSGGGKVQRFSSVDELMMQSTGAALPVEALFSWLRGTQANVSGWSADLSRYDDGRITAKRVLPTPQADLRVVLDR